MNIFLGRLAIFIVIFGTWQLSSGPLIAKLGMRP